MRRPALTHYRTDDYSQSAYTFSPEREKHCQVSLRYYRAGDRLTEIHFADIPEIINIQRIENTFLFNPCTQVPPQA